MKTQGYAFTGCLMKLNKQSLVTSLIAVAAVILFFVTFFGGNGIKTAVILLAVFWLPTYLIFTNILEGIELGIISWILSPIILSSITYPLALAIGSLSLAAWFSWAMLIAVSLLLRVRKKSNPGSSTEQAK